MGRGNETNQLEVVMTLPIWGIIATDDVGIPALRELLQKLVEDLRHVNVENDQTGNLSGHDSDVVAFVIIPIGLGRLHIPDRIFRPSRQERILTGIFIPIFGGSDWGKSPATNQVTFDFLYLIHDYFSSFSVASAEGTVRMKRLRSSEL